MKILFPLIAGILITFISCNNESENKTKEGNSDSTKQEMQIQQDTIIEQDTIKTENTNSINGLSLEERIDEFRASLDKVYLEIGKSTKGEHILETSDAVKTSMQFKKNSTVKYGDVEGIYPVANIFVYKFEDETKCNITFEKWLDCFGGECDKIKVGENKKAIKMPPMYVIKNNEEIIVLKYLCEHQENNWSDFKSNMFLWFGNENSKVINIACGGPLIWE
ncbi:MAG: hypothetical protein JXR58_00970 [Bacteroidales bacterium]|nr:hypothetical protein [Bacteroidales bacterium]